MSKFFQKAYDGLKNGLLRAFGESFSLKRNNLLLGNFQGEIKFSTLVVRLDDDVSSSLESRIEIFTKAGYFLRDFYPRQKDVVVRQSTDDEFVVFDIFLDDQGGLTLQLQKKL